MVRIAIAALLFALLPTAAQAQVVYNRSGGFGATGAVGRYSTPFIPGYNATRTGGGAPRQFTWYTVHGGYSHGPQTGLPWRTQDLQYQRRQTGDATAGAGGYARAFRPSRRAFYARTANEPGEYANARHEETLRPAVDRERVNPRAAVGPTR